MAMMTCKDCGHQVSTKAAACPHCGRKLAAAGKDGVAGAVIFLAILCGLALFGVIVYAYGW